MKRMKITITALLALLITQTIKAQVGRPFIHDPSTIVEADGKYYTFGTGGGGLGIVLLSGVLFIIGGSTGMGLGIVKVPLLGTIRI